MTSEWVEICVLRNLLFSRETTARNASLLPTERNDDLATVYSLSPKQTQNNNNNSNELQQQQSNNEYSIKRATWRCGCRCRSNAAQTELEVRLTTALSLYVSPSLSLYLSLFWDLAKNEADYDFHSDCAVTSYC